MALRLGFIGTGRMATALAQGFVESGRVNVQNITTSDPCKDRLALLTALGANTTHDNCEVISACDVLILAVKPQVIPEALQQVAPLITDGHLVISLAAGVSILQLNTLLRDKGRLIRTMPNTPCMVGCGATAFSAGPRATPSDCSLTSALFSSIGICEHVQEDLLDVVTGLSGSGPAYIFQTMQALAAGGVAKGLPRDMAQKFAIQTVKGAATMAEQTGKPLSELIDGVLSPGGTTIAGMKQLEKGGLSKTLISAVRAATERAVELGQQPEEENDQLSRSSVKQSL